MKWQPTYKEIASALEKAGWSVILTPDAMGGWLCRLDKGERKAEAAGVTKLSALWAAVLELIRALPLTPPGRVEGRP